MIDKYLTLKSGIISIIVIALIGSLFDELQTLSVGFIVIINILFISKKTT